MLYDVSTHDCCCFVWMSFTFAPTATCANLLRKSPFPDDHYSHQHKQRLQESNRLVAILTYSTYEKLCRTISIIHLLAPEAVARRTSRCHFPLTRAAITLPARLFSNTMAGRSFFFPCSTGLFPLRSHRPIDVHAITSDMHLLSEGRDCYWG